MGVAQNSILITSYYMNSLNYMNFMNYIPSYCMNSFISNNYFLKLVMLIERGILLKNHVSCNLC